MRDLTW